MGQLTCPIRAVRFYLSFLLFRQQHAQGNRSGWAQKMAVAKKRCSLLSALGSRALPLPSLSQLLFPPLSLFSSFLLFSSLLSVASSLFLLFSRVSSSRGIRLFSLQVLLLFLDGWFNHLTDRVSPRGSTNESRNDYHLIFQFQVSILMSSKRVENKYLFRSFLI